MGPSDKFLMHAIEPAGSSRGAIVSRQGRTCVRWDWAAVMSFWHSSSPVARRSFLNASNSRWQVCLNRAALASLTLCSPGRHTPKMSACSSVSYMQLAVWHAGGRLVQQSRALCMVLQMPQQIHRGRCTGWFLSDRIMPAGRCFEAGRQGGFSTFLDSVLRLLF